MEDLNLRIKNVLEKLNIDEKRMQIREIEAESLNPDFWKDHKNATAKMIPANLNTRSLCGMKKPTQAVSNKS